MLEFSKFILDKMSFNEDLFMKELRKLITWSESKEANDLIDWCNLNYGDKYGDKINEIYNSSRKQIS